MTTILMKRNLPIVALLVFLSSCADYLEMKPDKSLAIPDNIRDLQALMDNHNYFTLNYPVNGDIASDYFYLSTADWSGRNERERQTYIWDPEVDMYSEWLRCYTAISYCNVVLNEISDAALGEHGEHDRDRVRGLAHFYRGWHFFILSQLFSPTYSAETASQPWGIPLRTDPDINLPTKRSTVEDTYDQVIYDLDQAASLLPTGTGTSVRPARSAAHAALARVYLIMGQWERAVRHADASLDEYDQLLDYNELDIDSRNPFAIDNKEVLLYTTLNSISASLSPTRAKADSVLISTYKEHDLRKHIFYTRNNDGSYSFKGNYSGTASSAQLFSGLAVDEVYLIKAEGLARQGLDAEALDALNKLAENRYKRNEFEPFTTETVANALDTILKEREKELAFRAGIRWSDLRRLNLEPEYAKTLIRNVDGREYTLPPNDLRYTFLIPAEVIDFSGIEQNLR